jgi:L-arabinonolactonase
VTLVVDARNRLGECPLWCERSGTLYWTDIEGRTISRLLPGGAVEHWTLPARVGSFAFCENGTQLLLGLDTGIALFDTASGALSPIVPVEADLPATRINDGRCDRQGRFVFGMFNAPEEPVGGFYRVHPDLRVERLPLPLAAVGNSIAFSPDGATMYYTDSPARMIWRLAYGDQLGEPEVFVRLAKEEGFADGSCIDADGGLWNAQWEGSCVVRYDASGRETARLALPVTRPTCPAFGGADLSTLYVTSARGGLDKEALRAQPEAGGVFALQAGWRGLPESRFVSAR